MPPQLKCQGAEVHRATSTNKGTKKGKFRKSEYGSPFAIMQSSVPRRSDHHNWQWLWLWLQPIALIITTGYSDLRGVRPSLNYRLIGTSAKLHTRKMSFFALCTHGSSWHDKDEALAAKVPRRRSASWHLHRSVKVLTCSLTPGQIRA